MARRAQRPIACHQFVDVLLDPAIGGEDQRQHLAGAGQDGRAVVDDGDLDACAAEIDGQDVDARS